jgi:hypothetical protein
MVVEVVSVVVVVGGETKRNNGREKKQKKRVSVQVEVSASQRLTTDDKF